ncbi:MAG: hypothetical protein IT329_06360 [Caldilineaceae bacterium]|nr:hypothetical protein [Caldilineaceae bacterium]
MQVVTLAALPLTLRLFDELPDRGYALAKTSAVVVTGVLFWLGYSVGLLRNEVGAAWLAVALVAGASYALGRNALRRYWREVRVAGNWRVIIAVEALFLAGFVLWAVVRAYDPAANHTEKPMDLMFMNSIWAGTTFPPQDAWFAGYPISYYYLGYWLLTALGRLAGQPPAIAYNVGQAAWFGLLLIGCFGVVTNLLALGYDRRAPLAVARSEGTAGEGHAWVISAASMAGGVLAALAVGVIGNLMMVLEWLYAMGFHVMPLARWVGVPGFPERAIQSGNWYIGMDWWWWRSSRVIGDLNLLGQHLEVIDEFPMFSYVLGDNHPHVLAMPVVLVVIGLALQTLIGVAKRRADAPETGWRGWARWAYLPLGKLRVGFIALFAGALLFLNTWDFPPYWALLVGCCAAGLWLASGGRDRWWQPALVVGAVWLVGPLLIYLPYFLSAQSQVGGIVPNLFNPTRLPQLLLMFGQFVPGIITLALLARSDGKPARRTVGRVALLVWGLPLLFLGLMAFLALNTGAGAEQLAGIALPDGATGYAPFMWARWGRHFWTALLVGAGLTATLSLLADTLRCGGAAQYAGQYTGFARVFALLLAALGLALVYTPEFVFLKDNFGMRMNTVFKFYYQGWLLLGLASAFAVAAAWRADEASRPAARVASVLALVLMASGLLFPVAATYAKTGGFRAEQPTLDATAYIAPDEQAAVAWVRTHTALDSVVLEGRGGSYNAGDNRISAMTGRPTLIGWEGHESQWRGRAYSEMRAGRPEALEIVYRSGTPDQIRATLAAWGIDYVYVGPAETEEYGISPGRLRLLEETLELAFEQGQVRVFRRR